MNNIAVLTSGGDAPGMNAAIRAVVRTAIYNKIAVWGVYRGFQGLIDNDIISLQSRDVSNIIQRGGTFLKSARCKDFMTKEGRAIAFQNLKERNIDALVVIGGNGTFTGALTFEKEWKMPCIGIPGTIDNDLFGTDYSIGFDTAINTAMQAIDKIRDTASAHNRLFFIEVMGRDAGFLALKSSIASGAEGVLIPEVKTHLEELHLYLENSFKEKKSSGIIVVAEGDEEGGAYEIARKVRSDFEDYDVRVSVIGHMQRGGSPSALDRINASLMGTEAVNALLNGHSLAMVGIQNGQAQIVPFEEAINHKKSINNQLYDLLTVLNA